MESYTTPTHPSIRPSPWPAPTPRPHSCSAYHVLTQGCVLQQHLSVNQSELGVTHQARGPFYVGYSPRGIRHGDRQADTSALVVVGRGVGGGVLKAALMARRCGDFMRVVKRSDPL